MVAQVKLMVVLQGLKRQGVPVRTFLSTLHTLLELAPCSRIFAHQSLDDEDSDIEDELEEDAAEQQPLASTSAPASGADHTVSMHSCKITRSSWSASELAR